MTRKSVMTGALVVMLLASLAPVTAYHIDAAWVPVDAATGENLNCPTGTATHGPMAPNDNPGTDCSNQPARGWGTGPLGLVVCEQNRVGDTPGTPGTNGMCFASNQNAVTGPNECAAGGQFDPTRAGSGQTPATSHISDSSDPPIQCLDKHDWTKLRIVAWGDSTTAAGCVTDPHQTKGTSGCAPDLAGSTSPNHAIYGQVRVGSNANGMMLSPPKGECSSADNQALGGTDGAGNVGDPTASGACNPRGDDEFNPDFKTFYYRELLAYWADGGHVTFFVHFGASDAKMSGGRSTQFGGSYWAESITGNPADTSLECNRLYDDREENDLSFPGTKDHRAILGYYPPTSRPLSDFEQSYFDIFEPITYEVGLTDDAANTVCRGDGW